jgi:hypothetical protein
MAQFGDVRYSRAVRGAVWTQFRCCVSAKQSLGMGYSGRVLSAGGVEWQVSVWPGGVESRVLSTVLSVPQVSPQHDNWQDSLTEELSTVFSPVLSVAENSHRMSQLQLQRTNGVDPTWDEVPAKMPPPRPVAPPPRPSAPPSRSAGQTISKEDPLKPCRPAPARPGSGGFSDLFSGDRQMCPDIPITFSSDSLASLTWPEDEDPPVPDKATQPPPPTAPRRNIPTGRDQDQPPPVPIRTLPSVPSGPPTFSPPSLPTGQQTSEPPSVSPPPGPPPSRPPPGLPRLPGRPAAGAPPPVPRR